MCFCTAFKIQFDDFSLCYCCVSLTDIFNSVETVFKILHHLERIHTKQEKKQQQQQRDRLKLSNYSYKLQYYDYVI